MTNHTITIRTQTKLRPMRSVYFALTQIGVIGIGVMTNSAAMQWVGFLVLILMAIGMAHEQNAKTDGISIAEARKELDRLEKTEI